MSDPEPRCTECGLRASDGNLLHKQPDGSWKCEGCCDCDCDDAARLTEAARGYAEENVERFCDPSYKPAQAEREEVL